MFHINDLIMGVNTTLLNNLIQHRLLRKRMMWPANLPDLNPTARVSSGPEKAVCLWPVQRILYVG
jgi:hypothetical protein